MLFRSAARRIERDDAGVGGVDPLAQPLQALRHTLAPPADRLRRVVKQVPHQPGCEDHEPHQHADHADDRDAPEEEIVQREAQHVAPGTEALARPEHEGQRARLRDQIEGLFPQNGTPLYEATQEATETIQQAYDPEKINAVVLLTDGVNDDGDTSDDADQLDQLIGTLRGGEGVNARAVRVFPIAYGTDADTATLRRIAEASTGALYVATNPATINDVFTAVVSNF